MTNACTETHLGLGRVSRWNAGRDIAAALLLGIALVLPWNLSFGVGVPGSSTVLFALVVIVTLLAWGALIAGYVGRRGKRSVSPPTASPSRTRFGLALPYLVVAAGFVAFTFVQAMRFGGSGDVPPGIGPGLLAGLAGALFVAQPPVSGGGRPDRWFGVARVIGVAAALLASVAVLGNLYWRTRYPVQALAEGAYGGQNIAVIATAVVYGAVAWVAVLVGLRWTFTDRPASRLATVALGASTVLGAAVVWMLGVGRDIDAFHGIAQTTSTAAVGFEGYVAWVAIGAIVAPWALRAATPSHAAVGDWREAVRKCLALIAIWCAGSALLRVFDLIVAASLELPYSAYDSIALLAFDVVAGAAAMWIRLNINGGALHPVVLSAAAAVLCVLTICRVIVGVGLAPRILYSVEPEALRDAVYGNMLEQQITSTFDVVLCWLALAVVATSVVVFQRGELRRKAQAMGPAAPTAPTVEAATAAVPAVDPSTQRLAQVDVSAPTAAVSPAATPTAARPTPAPKIAREAQDSTEGIGTGTGQKPSINRVLEESTRRFAAGTTYTGTGSPRQPPES